MLILRDECMATGTKNRWPRIFLIMSPPTCSLCVPLIWISSTTTSVASLWEVKQRLYNDNSPLKAAIEDLKKDRLNRACGCLQDHNLLLCNTEGGFIELHFFYFLCWKCVVFVLKNVLFILSFSSCYNSFSIIWLSIYIYIITWCS